MKYLLLISLLVVGCQSHSKPDIQSDASPIVIKPAVDIDKEWFIERSVQVIEQKNSFGETVGSGRLTRIRDHEEGVGCYVYSGMASTYGGHSQSGGIQCMRIK